MNFFVVFLYVIIIDFWQYVEYILAVEEIVQFMFLSTNFNLWDFILLFSKKQIYISKSAPTKNNKFLYILF